MENINIEQIMEEIRADIRARGLQDDEIKFNDIILSQVAVPYNMQSFKEELEKMAEDKQVLSYRDVASDRPGIGKLVTFIKKLNRRLVAFYIEPIVDDQNKVNEEAMNMFLQTFNKFAEQEEKISNFEKEIYALKKRCNALEEELKKK